MTGVRGGLVVRPASREVRTRGHDYLLVLVDSGVALASFGGGSNGFGGFVIIAMGC